MNLVQNEQLEAKYGVYLEVNNDNVLTNRSMPWLDIGDLPSSYQADKSEAFQVYVVPVNQVPTKLNIEYSVWQKGYDLSGIKRSFKLF